MTDLVATGRDAGTPLKKARPTERDSQEKPGLHTIELSAHARESGIQKLA